ncbi:hypothetical protein QX776_13760 [Alteromonadaceae bacterium BrNp21-10]|nr:hypothetical protein [Alteromonadaceae bacterium BrNp21-10]
MPILLWFAFSLFSVVFCYGVAKYKGANARFWIGMAMFFGPLAMPFVFLARKQKPSTRL